MVELLGRLIHGTALGARFACTILNSWWSVLSQYHKFDEVYRLLLQRLVLRPWLPMQSEGPN